LRTITLLQPRRLTIGSGCLQECESYLEALAPQHLHIITSPSQSSVASQLAAKLARANGIVSIDDSTASEPTIQMFVSALARAQGATCIVGLGGGSPLDVAKLVAALLRSDQNVEDCFGIGLLRGRTCHLVCVPTTSGTGSEVSPNAILLDEAAKLKKGVVSPHLVPDATFIDPSLTLTMSPAVTASTGLDALTHCIEAYTNKFAHPVIDVYATQGIILCGRHLVRAVTHPEDLTAREGMSLASFYGGLCLGPVNTAAVHALAYPLGGEFHLAHGLSNAILLPHVFRFNAEASPVRHAAVALALGAKPADSYLETAYAGADKLQQMATACGITSDLRQYGITPNAIPNMARSAMTVTRLLKNNPREITEADCIDIYARCFEAL
jgi:alcohol dehydrogenase